MQVVAIAGYSVPIAFRWGHFLPTWMGAKDTKTVNLCFPIVFVNPADGNHALEQYLISTLKLTAVCKKK